MRPPAQIHELALFIETHLLVLKVLEQFHFIGLALTLEKVKRLLPGNFPTGERQVLLDQFLHPGLDTLKIFGSKGLGRVKIIIKPGFNGRADGDLDTGEEGTHRLSHDMGGAVADDV